MEKIHFSIYIEAPKEKVWNAMLGDAGYREWTKAFNPGSYYKGDWSQGSKMLFLGPNPKTGVEGGMVGRITESRMYEFVSIEYLGLVANGVEDTTSDEVKKWTGGSENYTFLSKDTGTELLIDININQEYKTMFEGMWPKALLLLKSLVETGK